MQEFWSAFFSSDYMPHGHCYLWQPGILWTNIISDLVIAFSYFSIPFVLLSIVQKRKEQKFKNVFVLFALFIFSCGITHLFSIYTIWHGTYGLHGIFKAITAIVSAITAFMLFLSIDKIIAIPTPAELKKAQEKAAQERIKRVSLEIETRANSIFKFSIELFPTGMLILDKYQNIQIANKRVEDTFGYSKGELNNKNISLLLEASQIKYHEGIENNRIVWGITKVGIQVPVEISLSVHEFEKETYTFASVVNVVNVGIQKKRALKSSQRLQRAIELADVGIWEWNLLTNKLWLSPKLKTLVDITMSDPDIPLDAWFSHIHPEDLPSVKESLESHLAGEGSYDVMYRGFTKRGDYQWFRAVGDTIFDSVQKPILMSGTLSSINQLKILQTEIEDKNQFLDAILTQSNSAIFIIDLTKRQLTFTNNQVSSLWGYSQEELQDLMTKNKLIDLFHPDDQLALVDHRKTLHSAELHEKHSFEFRFKHKEGFWVWSLSKNSVYSTDSQNSVHEILGSAIDITESKVREESIRRMAKEFIDTFEQAAVGISHVDLDGSWLRVNGKLCEILGYAHEELSTMTFQELTHPDDLGPDQALVKQLYKKEIDHYVLEKRYVHKNGSDLWARITVSMVLHENGEPDHYISVVEDIAQQKSLENDLRRSNEELEQFAYVASHDLKEPLRTLQTYTTFLISDLAANKTNRVKQDKEFIDSASTRMTSLIDDLLQFSRIGHTKIELAESNLSELVQNIINDLEAKILETNTSIDVDKLPTIITDEKYLRLAIQNLIQNAIKFCQEGVDPIIAISAQTRMDGKLLIDIKDNGIGIHPDHQVQIFGLFKKLHSNAVHKGTGLGLAIVKKIIQQLGGEITVASNLGEGSTFTISLPYTKEEEQ
jgi:PAS domain S-box-containing protein